MPTPSALRPTTGISSSSEDRATKQDGRRAGGVALRFREIAPAEALRDTVKCFWTLEQEYPKGGVQDVHPDGCVELIFNFGAPYVPEGAKKQPLAVASVVGLQDKTIHFRVEGVVKVVAARLRPWGAFFLVRDSVATLVNSVRGLDREWAALAERMRRCVERGSYEGAVAALERFLLAQEISDSYYLRVIRAAAQELDATNGTCRVADLAQRSRLSIPQLRRGFRRVVGTTPKAFARTVRFERAMAALMFGDRVDLTRLAIDCGYADHAHLSREFKALGGRTPSAFAAQMAELRRALRSTNVVFLQASRTHRA